MRFTGLLEYVVWCFLSLDLEYSLSLSLQIFSLSAFCSSAIGLCILDLLVCILDLLLYLPFLLMSFTHMWLNSICLSGLYSCNCFWSASGLLILFSTMFNLLLNLLYCLCKF